MFLSHTKYYSINKIVKLFILLMMTMFLTGCVSSCSEQRNTDQKSTENMQRYEKTVHKNSDGTGFTEEKITQQVTTGTIVIQQSVDYKLPMLEALTTSDDTGLDGLLGGLAGLVPGGAAALFFLKKLMTANNTLKKVVNVVDDVPAEDPTKKAMLDTLSKRMDSVEKAQIKATRKTNEKEKEARQA
jgi:hypothetical protein